MRIPALVTCLGLLAGCAALESATRALDAYEVRSVGAVPQASGGALSRDLIVELPVAAGALDTERILIRPTPLEAQYLPEARWTDTVPVMIQTVMVRGLQQANAVRFVGRRPIGVGGDFALLSEITDFQAEIEPDTDVVRTRVRIVASLVRESDAAVVSSRVFTVDGVAPSTQTLDVVNALDASMARLMPEFVGWAMSAVGARVS